MGTRMMSARKLSRTHMKYFESSSWHIKLSKIGEIGVRAVTACRRSRNVEARHPNFKSSETAKLNHGRAIFLARMSTSGEASLRPSRAP